jgi:hypothetical protein
VHRGNVTPLAIIEWEGRNRWQRTGTIVPRVSISELLADALKIEMRDALNEKVYQSSPPR